jgi:hypothetical protein
VGIKQNVKAARRDTKLERCRSKLMGVPMCFLICGSEIRAKKSKYFAGIQAADMKILRGAEACINLETFRNNG